MKTDIWVVALLLLSFVMAPTVQASEAQEMNAKLKSLKEELTAMGTLRIREIENKLAAANTEHVSAEQQVELLKKLAQLQTSFELQDQSKATNDRLVALLGASKSDPSLLINATLDGLGFSRGSYQSDDQEEACQKTLKDLYSDVAKHDPCLRAQVLSRWISWYPTQLKVRATLIAALSKCSDTDKETMAMKANAYLWASGYQPTNHTLYIAPRSPELLRKSYDCALAGDEVDVVFRTRKLMLFNKEALTEEQGGGDIFRNDGTEQFDKLFAILANSIDAPVTQSFVTSNVMRNEMTDLFNYGKPDDVIAVVQSWRKLLQKVPPRQYISARDSQYELALASLLLGASYTEIKEYDKAETELGQAMKIAETLKAEVRKNFDWDGLRKSSILSMEAFLKGDSEDKRYNPLYDLGDSFSFSINHRSEDVNEIERAVVLNTAIIQANRDLLSDATKIFSDLEKEKTDDALGAVSALLADSAVLHGDASAAARFFDCALKYRNWRDFVPAKDNPFGAHSNGLMRVDWPPKCIPPSPPMPRFHPVFIPWSVLPKRTDLLNHYGEFLKTHSSVNDALGAQKEINRLVAGHEKLIRDNKSRAETYNLALEENAIKNLIDTEPLAALKRLRSVIEQRRARSNEKLELIASLTGLGEQLNLLGFTKDAISPLEEAVSLSKTLAATTNSSEDASAHGFPDHVPNPRLVEVDPEIAMAKVKMESGDFDDAERLIIDAIRICDQDKYQKFESIECSFLLIDCLVAAEKLESSQHVLAETRNKCNEQKWSGWNDKLAIAEMGIATLKNGPEELNADAKSRVVAQTKTDEFDSVAKVRTIIGTDTLLGQFATTAKSFTDAKRYLDDAEAQFHRLPVAPKTLKATLAEARAKMYVANGNLDMAKEQYGQAIQYLSEAISPDCRRVAVLRKELGKLSTG